MITTYLDLQYILKEGMRKIDRGAVVDEVHDKKKCVCTYIHAYFQPFSPIYIMNFDGMPPVYLYTK